jgi:hypothetical protein
MPRLLFRRQNKMSLPTVGDGLRTLDGTLMMTDESSAPS